MTESTRDRPQRASASWPAQPDERSTNKAAHGDKLGGVVGGNSPSDSFDDFFERRQQAAAAYVAGNGTPLDELVLHGGQATFHSPSGDTVIGADGVATRYLSDSKAFKSVGTSRFEILQKEADAELGFWTVYQVATVQIGDMPQPTQLRIRVTEIFRKLGGAWKMIHRHADLRGQPST